jgi:predicted HTH transcriptional regulator
MHSNSLTAWHELDPDGRKAAIIDAMCGQAMTDREVKNNLSLPDMNCVRPRITELVKDGLLLEVGSKKDEATGRTVRVCRRALA